MTISVGQPLPDAKLIRIGENGAEAVSVQAATKGRKVVIFAVPGAFTPTCHSAHVPSFIRTKDGFAEKGVDEIICVSVNDPHVMRAWGEATGATAKGLTLLGDADASFTKAIGMNYTHAPSGFFDRSSRYALYAVDGVVKVLNQGKETRACEISGGEAMLDAI